MEFKEGQYIRGQSGGILRISTISDYVGLYAVPIGWNNDQLGGVVNIHVLDEANKEYIKGEIAACRMEVIYEP